MWIPYKYTVPYTIYHYENINKLINSLVCHNATSAQLHIYIKRTATQ